MTSPHDSLFWQVFSDPRHAVGELRALRASFLAARTAPDTGTAMSAVLSYVAKVLDLPPEELLRIVRSALGPELEDEMASTYNRLLNEERLKGLQEGLEKGKAEGKAEERAEMLLKQLERRFGDVPQEIVSRVRVADLRQLEEWALRVLDAESLEQVFAGG